MLGPVSTWTGDRLQMGKPYQYVTNHPRQLSLAIPSVRRRSEYQQKLGHKQAHCVMHKPCIRGLAV